MDDDLIRFEKEVYVTKDKVLFVRDCYLDLFELVYAEVSLGYKCIVTGTPGIGKSFFGYYAIGRLLDAGFTVIHIDMGWDYTNLYVPENPSDRVKRLLSDEGKPEGRWAGRLNGEKAGLKPDAAELYEKLVQLEGEVVVIVDPPKDFSHFLNPTCGLLVVTSPSTQRMSSFNSAGDVDYYFMLLWDEEELRTLLTKRKGCPLTEKEDQELLLRIFRFGPIPRYVARSDFGHDKMIQISDKATTFVLSKLETGEMKEMLNPFNANPEFSGRLVHLVVDKTFTKVQKRFATEMIKKDKCLCVIGKKVDRN